MLKLLVEFGVIFAVIITLSFFEISLLAWTCVIGGSLLVLQLSFLASFWFLLPVWVVFAAVSLVLNIKFLRSKLISHYLFNLFRKILPPMSDTEREAIEAGDTFWEAELFRGSPNWQKLMDLKEGTLTAEEKNFLNNQTVKFCSLLNDWKIVHEDFDLSPEAWSYLKQEKFFGMIIPKEYGGLGFSALAHSSIVSKIASRSITAAVTTMVPNSLGPAELLLHYGTEEQKEHYLRNLACGKEIPCFALTAPDAGSDAGSLTDHGIICYDDFNGEQILGIKLNWNKRYITLAPVATVLGLAFKLQDPDNLLKIGKVELGITLCLIPTNTPGVEIGKRHFPLDLGFMNGPTRGVNVFVPLDYIIGGKEMIGRGWHMLMECLSIGRSISLPALTTGIGQMLFRTTGAYAHIRKQFKISIGKFEGVEEALTRIAGYTYMVEATRLFTVSAIDNNLKPAIASAITKYHITELGRRIVNDTMDVHGGRGIMLGKNNYVGRVYQSIPISITVEGANILTRNLIIFGQGAIRCHPFIVEEMQALSNSNEIIGRKQFEEIFAKHIKYSFTIFARCILFGITRGVFVKTPLSGKLHRYLQKMTWMSSALALASEISMGLLGGELKRRERLSARLGDVLSHLYIASAIVKFTIKQKNLAEAMPYACWGIEYNLAKLQDAFFDIFDNFPRYFFGGLLKWIIFPMGRTFKYPSDKLDHILASHMLHTSSLRDELTHLCYFSKDKADLVGRMELALEKAEQAEVVEEKIKKSKQSGVLSEGKNFIETISKAIELGVISAMEAVTLQEYEELRLMVIQVDEFSSEYFKHK